MDYFMQADEHLTFHVLLLFMITEGTQVLF